MARFIKHVGKHGDRKVAVIFRQIPGDEHLCLVVYTETIGQNIHDPLIACIESAEGQQSENLGDALNRAYTKDGKIILQVLHHEGMLKRVQCEQVMMTPSPNQKIKLSELNAMLNEMAKGEEAVRRLAEIDASRGLQDPKDVAKRKRGESTVNIPPSPIKAAPQGLLGDGELANNLRQQAVRMTNEAKGLLAEADRLLKEASGLDGTPAPSPAKPSRAKKANTDGATAPKKSSRAKKVAVSD